MEYPKLFLNKVIEEDDVNAFKRYNITKSDMHSEIDRKTFEFIEGYAEDNGGKAPSYATVVAEVDNFEYVPGVSDNFKHLTRKIKDYTVKRTVLGWFETGMFERKLNEMDGKDFLEEYLLPEIESVSMRTSVRDKVGTDVKEDGDKAIEEFDRRKAGESFRVWKSKYSAIEEYISGNMYTVYGESGRGKSVLALEDAIYAATQGANVLLWTLEMGWFEVLVRIYASISGEQEVTTAYLQGVEMGAGFSARDMRVGNLSEEFEEAFKVFVKNIGEYVEGNITVRAVDDEDFNDRSLRALQADIEKVDADYVVIDPFYYLDYESNTSRKTGGDAENTSQKLRALTGKYSVVTIAITQSDVQKSEDDEEGLRELRLPSRDEVRKTAALMEDAAVLIGIDSDYKQGLAIVGNMKGRDGGEGDISNVLYIPQYGIVTELETGEEAMKGFDF